MRGQCRACMERRDVYSVSRKGGGTYRRGNRTYPSRICEECAVRYVEGDPGSGASSVSGFGLQSMAYVLERIGSERTLAVAAAWRERRADRIEGNRLRREQAQAEADRD